MANIFGIQSLGQTASEEEHSSIVTELNTTGMSCAGDVSRETSP